MQQKIATAIAAVNTDPSLAQQEAGNYAKGHVDFQGLPLTFENPKGSVRRGVDCNGKEWESQMQHHYGYIKRTTGADGDHVDFFLGDELASDQVFIVNQIDQGTGSFDEHKVMLGFSDKDAAHDAYLSNYEAGWNGAESIHQLHIDDFKEWLSSGDQSGPYQPVMMLEAVNNHNWHVARVNSSRGMMDLLEAFDEATGQKTEFEREVDELHQMVKGLSIATIDASVFFESKLDELINEKSINDAIKRVKNIKLMTPETKADLMRHVNIALDKVKKDPPKYRSIIFNEIDLFYQDHYEEGDFTHKATNAVIQAMAALCREAMSSDKIAGIGPVKDIINQNIEQSALDKKAADQRVRDTPIKVTTARLVAGYEIPDMKADLAEFYQLCCGAMQPIELAYKKKRAHANRRLGLLNVGAGLNRSTLWHELGHFVEFHNPWILQEAKALLQRRFKGITGGKQTQPLAVMCNNLAYGKDEWAINDGFFHPYVGKIYGDWPNVNSTEVISMGFECLSSDKGIAELAQKDPEHLAIMLAIVKRLGDAGRMLAEVMK